MNIFTEANRMVCATLSNITKTAEMVNESIEVGTAYVSIRAAEQKEVDRGMVLCRAGREIKKQHADLAADSTLADIVAKLDKKWA